jgi:polyvinyl alcohol dehydrogenase (cytochrome)
LQAVLMALVAVPAAAAAVGEVSSWGYDLEGSRFAAAEATITPQNVGRLRLKWVFAVPTATGAQSQPVVADGRLYFGGTNGVFYALNAATGKLIWRFNTRRVIHVASNALRDGPAIAGGVVYFGDQHANLFALDAQTGKLRWRTKLDSHPAAVITGSPIVYDGRVIVGVSSIEELFAVAPAYPCCTFRGGLVALDAQTGRLLWRHYMVPQPSLIAISEGCHGTDRPGSGCGPRRRSTRVPGRSSSAPETTTSGPPLASRTRSWRSTPRPEPRSGPPS